VNIGEKVVFDGRVYVLRGLDPMSVPNRRVQLEDPATGEVVEAPFEAVREPAAESGFDSEGLG
jgi:hypothetical protein